MKVLNKGLLIAVVPLIYQLTFVGLLGAELAQLEYKLERVARSKEIVGQSLELIRTVLEGYYQINLNSEVDGLYDPETTAKSCVEFRSRVKDLATLAETVPEQQVNIAKLSDSSLALTRVLGWAMKEQRQGLAHWQQVDELCYGTVLNRLIELMSTASSIVEAENNHLAFSREIEENKRQLQDLMYVFMPVGFAISLIMGIVYAQSIAAPILRLKQNSLLLSLQQPLLPTLAGDDELSRLDRSLHKVAYSLYESLNQEKALVDNAAETICTINSEGQLRSINKGGKLLLDLSTESLSDCPIFDFIIPEERLLAEEKLQVAANAATPYRFELKLLTKVYGQIDTQWSVLWSPSNKLFFCVITNITEEKTIERLKQDFLEMLAGDLRTPLFEIKETLSQITSETEGALSAPVRQDLLQSEKSVQKLLSMVNNLLDFRRLDCGKIELTVTSFAFKPLAQEAATMVQSLAKAKYIDIRIIDRGLSISADREKFLQVLLNLLTNALKFSPAGGKVTLEAKSRKDATVITVKDEGEGVPEDALAKIFEPFEQTERGRQAGGTGLGLAICRMIVEAHSGNIQAEGIDGGKGTLFTVTLPHLT